MNILSIINLFSDGDRGDAAAIRTQFIIKGLLENNCNINIISYALDNNKNIKDKNNFSYLYRFKKNSKLNKYLKLILFPLMLFIKLITQRQSYDIILIDRIPFYLTLPISIVSKLFNKKIIWIINEFPANISRPESNQLTKAIEFISFKIIGKSSDITIVISEEHKKHYTKFSSKKTKILVIPILMDTKEISLPIYQNNIKKKIIYGGALSFSNGIDFLIDVAYQLSLKLDNFEIILFGPVISKEYELSIKEKINTLKLTEKVFLLDKMPNAMAIKKLKNADILIIPKIKDSRSIGYIPSKLGDFLFTGKPTITSNLGDIPKYIKDGYNGYLAEADSIQSYCECITHIIKNYDKAKSIGIKGIETALSFNYKVQAKKIYDEIANFN
ncbi:glycosyltransferase [Proteus terrae]|uniref:glycosyltransferase n=2 Tax=Proteus terrae TaxID=1574161 RepID=UPI0021BA5B92|nr:glycosyltransferase [Proteus terrae]MCT8232572.1 glycosyltransferase [Proteus terrae]